jgi:short-subunit dehydrogenase
MSKSRARGKRTRTVLITGASSGIGRELAKIYAENGDELVLCARRRNNLEELAAEIEKAHGTKALVMPSDLVDPEAPAAIESALRERGTQVDVLVNNAGVTNLERFVDADEQRLANLVQLNVASLSALIRLFLPAMIERGYGRILNVASLAAFQPVPSMALYGASKAFVLSLTEALSEELRGTGVTVTALCPGLTDTEMVSGAVDRKDLDLLPSFMLMDAKTVARAGFRACETGKVIEVPGVVNEWTANWVRFQPRWMVRMMGGLAAQTMESQRRRPSKPRSKPS